MRMLFSLHFFKTFARVGKNYFSLVFLLLFYLLSKQVEKLSFDEDSHERTPSSYDIFFDFSYI